MININFKCNDTVINSIKFKRTFNNSIAERLITTCSFENSTLYNYNVLLI